MKEVLIFDIEADGLLDTVTKIHCLVTKNYHTKEVKEYYNDNILLGIDSLINSRAIVGHNIIGYDIPCIASVLCKQVDTMCIDTYVWSSTLRPTRTKPRGSPPTVKAGHSLNTWGYRLGRWKPDHTDWSTFSPSMLHRCKEDVEINYLVLRELEREAGLTVEDYIGG